MGLFRSNYFGNTIYNINIGIQFVCRRKYDIFNFNPFTGENIEGSEG
jgi:hypothetical protein